MKPTNDHLAFESFCANKHQEVFCIHKGHKIFHSQRATGIKGYKLDDNDRFFDSLLEIMDYLYRRKL